MARRKEVSREGDSQDSQASDHSGESELRALYDTIKSGAEKKVKKKQSEYQTRLQKTCELWDDRWAEVASRHEQEIVDAFLETKTTLAANAKEQAMIVAEFERCKSEMIKALTQVLNLATKDHQHAVGEIDLGEARLDGLSRAEVKLFEDGLAQVAMNDRRDFVGISNTTDDTTLVDEESVL